MAPSSGRPMSAAAGGVPGASEDAAEGIQTLRKWGLDLTGVAAAAAEAPADAGADADADDDRAAATTPPSSGLLGRPRGVLSRLLGNISPSGSVSEGQRESCGGLGLEPREDVESPM
mmetsp:Transcript_145997/g.468154  ORF Transcript_145997/g.468154 Transcript_145997/m.468154 type:complete len:117 (+) Transcript_145997:2623-2973(+)